MKRADHMISGSKFKIEIQKRTEGFTMNERHFHDYFEIYYLISGRRYYFIEDMTYAINPGDLVFIPPSVIHKTIEAGSNEHERILITFQSSYFDDLANEQGNILDDIFNSNNYIYKFKPHKQNFIENIIKKILGEWENKEKFYNLNVKALLTELLVYSVRNIDDTNEAVGKCPEKYYKVSKIVNYINNNYMEPLNLTSVAKKFYISPFYLCRIFKEAIGFSFNEYLTSVRIKETQKLLKGTNFKVINIAEMSGFGSVSHFGRVFKDLTGMSPLQYRKKCKDL
jgi:YesN/AraC family two-component response regulator